ncbi:hypothetical protein [Streptomyces roseochromogenus]|uniref:Uncharacterized protein n=1 Tax=Streptomyces roseochromogenus subsp. oscitans DS 12.976 TaxID=1352936 RepID=V6KB27_STRRC|nr:hypothetical protein [Streptomyces roseochromogenus]EST29238.1 hypothetical protein M878_20925 [Streptomyces roseochromogenus subsp. oscitans DS 12.976]
MRFALRYRDLPKQVGSLQWSTADDLMVVSGTQDANGDPRHTSPLEVSRVG